MTFQDKVDDIAAHHDHVHTITPRELIGYMGFERRTQGVVAIVDKFLCEHDLTTNPHYCDVWIDGDIELKRAPKAMTRTAQDPVLRVRSLAAAKCDVVAVSGNATIAEAMTKMRLHGYSQLPVAQNGLRNITSYISWETIGTAVVNGVSPKTVSDCTGRVKRKLRLETPLLEAMEFLNENEFALVENTAREVCGIITTADISEYYLKATRPFILTQEIEQQIRLLLSDKFAIEEVRGACADAERTVESIDDLTFGEYLRFIQNDANWQKLGLALDKKTFTAALSDICTIRNRIMHFAPDGILSKDLTKLERMAALLRQAAELRG